MQERVLLPFLVISVFLLVCFSALVISKRLWRSHRERVSQRRRKRYLAVLRAGSDAELFSIARDVSWRKTVQEDLAATLAARPQILAGDQGARFRCVLRATCVDERLISQLGSRSAIKRGRAALLVAQLRLPGAVPALERLLFDPDRDVRQAALSGIAMDASEEAAWALLHALRREAMAPEWLVARLGHPWAVNVLMTACCSEQFRTIRAWIAEALGLARDATARKTLAELLLAGEDEERVRACRALGRVGCGAQADPLIEALVDPLWSVRAQAARALRGVDADRALDRLAEGLGDRSWWVRANCAETLRSTTRGVAVLRRAVHHPDRFARDRAVEALALEAAARKSGL
jgi:hypothetical protein